MQEMPKDKRPREAPAEEDATYQRAVLGLVLNIHPLQITGAELVREIAADPGDFADRDSIQRAARDLIAKGVLHKHGEFLLPTRATICLIDLVE